MIEIAIVEPPWTASRRVDPLGPIGHNFAGRYPCQALTAARHNAFRGSWSAHLNIVIKPFSQTASEAPISLCHSVFRTSLFYSPAAMLPRGNNLLWRAARPPDLASCHVATSP